MEKECYASINESLYPIDEIPLVSVAIIAYNLEKYIVECLESVLCQKTNFKVEIVIGEDCSTDNTLQILLNYQERFPNIIRVLVREKNLGLTPNSVDTQNNCKGKYIALLDGDDYWTDENKLQKQIDFLERNPLFSASAHQSTILRGSKEFPIRKFGIDTDAVFGINDTISHRKFHTSSLVYRRSIWEKTGGIPTTISSNERAIYPMLAVFGNIQYFKDDMCVYRLSPTGLNSKISTRELETDLNMLPWLKKNCSNFPISKFRSFLHLCMYSYPKKVHRNLLLKHYMLFIYYSFSYFPKNLGDVKYGTIEFINKFRNK